MKKLAIGIGVLLLSVLAAILVVPSFLDWNAYKADIVQVAREATGRALEIDGDLSLRLLPSPALTAEGIRLANVEGGSAPEMASIGALDIRLAFAPLLSGTIQVERLRLIEPVILLEVLPDGRTNWNFHTADAAAAAPAPSEPGGGIDLRIQSVEVENGRLVYRNARTGREEHLSLASANASAESLTGPFRAHGEAGLRGQPVSFDLALGAITSDQAVPVRVALQPRDFTGEAVISGSLQAVQTAPRFEGELKLASERPAALAAALLPDTALPPLADLPLRMSAKLTLTTANAGINDISLSLGKTQAAGAVDLAFADDLAFDAVIEISRLDLDALLASAAPEAAGAAIPAGAGREPAIALPLPPQGIRGTAGLTIEGVTWRGRVIRQVQVGLALADGRLELRNASALLPGGSDARLAGVLRDAEGEPAFAGRLELASDNLRGLLDWLAVDVGRVPAGRLANVVLTGDIDAGRNLVQLANLNMRLDNTTVSGGVAVRVQRRPSFGLSLQIDRLNLDGYLPAASPAPAEAGPGGAAGLPPPATLAMLDSFDTNLTLKVGQLTYAGTAFHDLTGELTLFGGTLTLKRFTVADVAGVQLTAGGAATGFSKQTAIDLRLALTAADLAGFGQASGLSPAFPWQNIAGVELMGVLNGTLETMLFSLDGKLAGARLSLGGSLGDPLGRQELEVTVNATHPRLPQLLHMLELAGGDGAAPGGSLKLAATARGTPAQVQVSANLDVAGLQVVGDGRIDDSGEQPRLEFRLTGQHGDAMAFVRDLGFDYVPAQESPGALEFALNLSGTPAGLALDDLSARLGPTVIAGRATLALDGNRPLLTATLQSDALDLDRFLPRVADTDSARPGATGAAVAERRWSRRPIRLSALDAFDASIELSAPGIVFQGYPFVEPRLTLALNDGTVSVHDLTGRLFDGEVTLQAVVETRPLLAIEVELALTGADAGKVLADATGLETLTGRLDLVARVRSRGDSQWDLVNGLTGSARMEAVDGVVRGFDLPAFAGGLRRPAGQADFAALAERTLSGGETGYRSIAGSWSIDNGVARASGMRALFDGGDATMSGVVVLPSWRLDLKTAIRLAGPAFADAPAFDLELTGNVDAPVRDLRSRDLERWSAARQAGEAKPATPAGDAPKPQELPDRQPAEAPARLAE